MGRSLAVRPRVANGFDTVSSPPSPGPIMDFRRVTSFEDCSDFARFEPTPRAVLVAYSSRELPANDMDGRCAWGAVGSGPRDYRVAVAVRRMNPESSDGTS